MKRKRPIYSRFYLYIFLALSMAIMLSILVLSAIFYRNAEQIVSTQVDTYLSSNLRQLNGNVEQIIYSVKKMEVQIFFDKSILKLLYKNEPNIYDKAEALGQLDDYRFISTNVSSIYLINRDTGRVYISSENITVNDQKIESFYDQDLMALLRNYHFDQSCVPVPRMIPVEGSGGNRYAGYSLLFYTAANPAVSRDIVVANIPENLIQDDIKKMDNAFGANTFILDREGRLVIDTTGGTLSTDLSSDNYVSRILASDSNSGGHFASQIGGKDTYVSYTATNNNGWRIVSLIPNSQIMKRINTLGNQILFVSALIFLVGTLLSLFLSRQLFSPISRALGKLESDNNASSQAIRQEFLRNVITSYHGANAGLSGERLAQMDIRIDPQSHMRVTLFRIDYYRDFVNGYSLEERTAVKAAISKFIGEHMPQGRSCEHVNMGEDRIVLLEFLPNGIEAENSERFTAILREIQQSVQIYLRISLSASFSATGESLQHITYLYNTALQNSFCRLFLGRGCVVSPEYVENLIHGEYALPEREMTQQLISVLMLGNYDEATAIYLKSIDRISNYSPAMANIAFSHLAYNITAAFETIRKNNFPNIPMSFNLSVMLNEYETIEEVNQQFISAFRNVAQMMLTKKSVQHEELIGKIRSIVEAQYSNSALSLDSIAEALNLSPQYLCTLYKKIANDSIPDLIMRTRLKQSMDLLRSTSLPVAQIAEQVGFANAGYFYRVFKEAYGATPGDFRKKRDNAV